MDLSKLEELNRIIKSRGRMVKKDRDNNAYGWLIDKKNEDVYLWYGYNRNIYRNTLNEEALFVEIQAYNDDIEPYLKKVDTESITAHCILGLKPFYRYQATRDRQNPARLTQISLLKRLDERKDAEKIVDDIMEFFETYG